VTKEKGDEAVACFKQAIRLKPDYAEAHCNLGLALLRMGQFRPAVEAFRHGHQFGTKQKGWRYPSAQWLRHAEQLVAFDERLPAILAGKDQPKDAAERLGLAEFCRTHRQRYAAAARFYEEAFAQQPALAARLAAYRYDAACVAALAGCGKGDRGHRLSEQQRSRWRQQALDWLRADLDAWRRMLVKGPGKVRPVVSKHMQGWPADSDFVGVRGLQALAKLPEAERVAWHKLWTDVADTLHRAAKPAPQKGSERK